MKPEEILRADGIIISDHWAEDIVDKAWDASIRGEGRLEDLMGAELRRVVTECIGIVKCSSTARIAIEEIAARFPRKGQIPEHAK